MFHMEKRHFVKLYTEIAIYNIDTDTDIDAQRYIERDPR